MSNLSSFKPSNVSTSQPSRVAAAAAPKQEPDIYEFLDDFSEDDDDVPTINIIKPPSQPQIPPKFQLGKNRAMFLCKNYNEFKY